MNDLVFDDLRWLNLLWAVLLVAAAGVYGIWQRGRAMRLFAAGHLLGRIAPRMGWARPVTRLVLVCLALTSLTGAIIGPRWGEREQTVVRRGIDVLVLLDVSRSMLARDIAPSRLERARLSIADDLLPALGGDRIGLIAFAGMPSVTCPLTSDYGFLRLALDDVSPRSAPVGGTLIGDAIRKAADTLDDKLDTHQVILLITDGEDHESFPVEAARKLWNERQIPIVAIGLGDPREGARIPVASGTGETYLEYKGETVRSVANFSQLREIAAAAGGAMFDAAGRSNFIPVGTRNFDLGEIYRANIVPAIDYQERKESQLVRLPSRYHPFAAAALVLLLIESAMRDGPRAAAGTGGMYALRREKAA